MKKSEKAVKKYHDMKIKKVFKEEDHYKASKTRIQSNRVYYYGEVDGYPVYTCKPKSSGCYRCCVGAVLAERWMFSLLVKR